MRTGLIRRVFRRSFQHVEEYAAAWSAANVAALDAEGPLWVVLGDSAAQGVGASSHLSGYVGVVAARLSQRDGVPWRVVNLWRSGARTREVVEVQWPAAADLRPDLRRRVHEGGRGGAAAPFVSVTYGWAWVSRKIHRPLSRSLPST